MSGKTLGKVQIGELIARGGMAEVYLGEHTTLNRKVAVKIMREFVDSDPDIKIRFEREARAVAGLRHPNIIQVFDFDLTDGLPSLIMEYVPGASLGAYLRALHKRGEKLSFDTISRILNSLASAIDYAHNHNLIHRDIKPANVLLRSASGPIDIDKPLPDDVEPILTDFGLVRLLDSSIQTSTGTVSGTPAYMSPEQARGEKVDLKTDIYSLGVLLYEMVAGMVPFDAESTFGILMKHINEPPTPIPGISSDLQAIIDRTLAKDPALRYESATQLANEFVSVFNGQTVSVNTLKLASMARASAVKAGQPPQPAALMRNLIVIGVFVLIGIAFVAIRRFAPPGKIAPIGQVSYSDLNGRMDKATFTFSNLVSPEAGTHYEAWYLAQGGETRLNIGAIKMGNARQGELVFTNPNKENLLGTFDQIEITIEPDNDPNPDESSGEVVASSVFPPLALIHVRHLDNSFSAAPNKAALVQGLLSTAEGVDASVQKLQAAFENNDEKSAQKEIEEIINQLVGKADTAQYKDWNSDGIIDDPSDGYGLLEGTVDSGDGYTSTSGYIPNTISHAQFAAQAIDATESIQTNQTNVVISVQNVDGWSKQLLEKAIQLEGMSFGPGMKPIIAEMLTLSGQILHGTDSNNNKKVEPIVGEGGAETAYEYAYSMAIMPLLPGAHQLPSPAQPIQK